VRAAGRKRVLQQENTKDGHTEEAQALHGQQRECFYVASGGENVSVFGCTVSNYVIIFLGTSYLHLRRAQERYTESSEQEKKERL
jgi:hypothetical protein